MTLLGIDTSGKTASVAVCDENTVLAQNTVYTKLTHSQVILPICKDVLKNAGLELPDVDGIAVSAGPGSYTGLRIGIAAVKAIWGTICAVMTARLDLVYCAVFRSDGKTVTRVTEDGILPLEELLNLLETESGDIAVVGDAADKIAGERFITAPPHLKLQLASSLCAVAFGKKLGAPDELEAAYLQITKAEKDRIQAEQN